MTAPALSRLPSRRFPRFPRRMIVDYSLFAAMVAGGAIVAVMLVTVITSFFRPIDASGWDIAQQLGNWFAWGIGFHVGAREFWLYVTHGRTRRHFYGEAVIFTLVIALVLAVLYAAGFWVEAPLYAILNWQQQAHEPTLFRHVLDTPLVVLESALTYMLWGAAGLCLGTAYYRSTMLGFLLTGFCLLMAQIVSISTGFGAGPIGSLVGNNVADFRPDLAVLTLAHLGATVAIFVAAWLVMRDAPIRSHGRS